MVFTPRERNIGIGTVGVLLVAGLYSYGVSPYLDRREAVTRGIHKASGEISDANVLFRKEHNLRETWDQMTAGGLKSDPSEAESQVSNAMAGWEGESRVTESSVRTERLTAEKDAKFQQSRFAYTLNGTVAQLSRVLYRVETASIPLKVTSAVFSSRKEGTNDVQLQLTMLTLCRIDADAPAVPTGGRANGGGR